MENSNTPPAPLTSEQQTACLDQILRGAPLGMACRAVGIRPEDVRATREADEEFRQQLADVQFLLSGNVAAALYKAAMLGNVTAQKDYLRLFKNPLTSQAQPTPQEGDLVPGMSFDVVRANLLRTMFPWLNARPE